VAVVADRIRTCLRYCAADKLWLAPDCGFSQTPRFLANEKMRVMVAAARTVREAIG
jgi:5-methyltetrahydropteroyltriglutamate--homocysteine methyltransferase